MKIVHDEVLLQKAVVELDLKSKLNIAQVRPVLCKYKKGELLSAPHMHQKYILFIVSGIAQVYGIRLDGRKVPVTLTKKGDVIGDMEFCNSRNSNLFSEAIKDILCVGISISDHREVLEQDVRFLKFLLSTVSSKVYMTNVSESPIISVKEKLIHYMEHECENQILVGVEHATMRLQCSRRQMQRVLSELCEQGNIEKIGKGRYRLVHNRVI